MSNSPDAIRADIEQTRRELGTDVDALADKVTPSKIMDRQTGKVKEAFGSLRNRVMGAADDAGSRVSDVGDGIADAKDRCPDQQETKNGVKDDDGCPDTKSPLKPGQLPDDI